MSFFDSFPVPERHRAERAPRRPWEHPDTIIPGSGAGVRYTASTISASMTASTDEDEEEPG